MAQLERNRNPFAAIVLAHLKSLQTRRNVKDRRGWKFRLVRSLLDRDLTATEIRELFRFIDWVLDLPEKQDKQFFEDVYQLEKEKNVSYISYNERRGVKTGKKEGLLKGIETALDIRFGDASLMPQVRRIKDAAKLEQILESIKTAASVDQLRTLVVKLSASGQGADA